MIVFIILMLIVFVVFAALCGGLIYFVADLLSQVGRKESTKLSIRTALLSIATIILFVFSYQSCSYVSPYGGSNDRTFVGWFLLIVAVVCGVAAFFCFGYFALEQEKEQKEITSKKEAEEQEIARKKAKKEQEALLKQSSKEKEELIDRFRKSSDHKYVEQFVGRFGNRYAPQELSNLAYF